MYECALNRENIVRRRGLWMVSMMEAEPILMAMVAYTVLTGSLDCTSRQLVKRVR